MVNRFLDDASQRLLMRPLDQLVDEATLGCTLPGAFGGITSESNPAVDSLFMFTARPFDPDSQVQNNLNRRKVAFVAYRCLQERRCDGAFGVACECDRSSACVFLKRTNTRHRAVAL